MIITTQNEMWQANLCVIFNKRYKNIENTGG